MGALKQLRDSLSGNGMQQQNNLYGIKDDDDQKYMQSNNGNQMQQLQTNLQMMQLLQQMKNVKNKSNNEDNVLNGFMNGNRDELIDEDPMQQFVSGMQQNIQMMQMLETMKSAVNANKFGQQQAGNTMFDPIVEEEKLNLSDESDDDDEAPQVDLFGGNDLVGLVNIRRVLCKLELIRRNHCSKW